ncbi:MMEL1 [Acanthosepion pharaonis]|uniref:MMEL1 n=1 Tax=Acanthosepion pharaonis TaxID=158019 RepID=A0A812CLA9_ACAPH|nr:MMEL1 [Sepia pharaonis]
MSRNVFPAGILQPPFYDEQYPLSMVFGAMGAVVGHEFTHGFDNRGAQYDKIGNLKNWWTQKSMENFRKRSVGLKKQYAKFPICKNSECDLHAYKKYVKDHNIKTMTLPGLSYTSDQLFFVGFAHIWCRKIQPKALIHQLLADPHSPAIARVILTLRNSEAFSTAFNCKKDSPMNPTIKYGVW